MQRLEVSGAVRSLYGSLGVKGLIKQRDNLIFNPIWNVPHYRDTETLNSLDEIRWCLLK